MAHVFRSSDVDRVWHPPPSRNGFVPPGQRAQFGRNMVRDALDLSAILGIDAEKRGDPLYHGCSMVAFLLFGCSRGLSSSRQPCLAFHHAFRAMRHIRSSGENASGLLCRIDGP
jgi:hypothetical protein